MLISREWSVLPNFVHTLYLKASIQTSLHSQGSGCQTLLRALGERGSRLFEGLSGGRTRLRLHRLPLWDPEPRLLPENRPVVPVQGRGQSAKPIEETPADSRDNRQHH